MQSIIEKLFLESKGHPIKFGGNILIMVDHFLPENHERLQLIFENCNSTWRQGVSLRVGRNGNEAININGQTEKHILLWHDTAPPQVDFEIVGGLTAIEVKNIWDTGKGSVESWYGDAAMIIEELPNGRRYRCSDGKPNEKFDDIIFRIERISPSTH